MGKENAGLGLGLTVILIGLFLSGIGLANIFSGQSVTPPTPDKLVETLPSAAGSLAKNPDRPAANGEALTTSGEQARNQLKKLMQDWRTAWANKNTDAYLAFYAADFQGNANTPEQWRANRQRILGQAKFIDLRIGPAKIDLESADLATLSFPLDYASDRFADHGTKTLQLRRDNGRWLIENETFTSN